MTGTEVCSSALRTVIVAAGCLFESDRVLLTQRKAGAHLAGMWEFPGGKVEPGEDPRAALARELREEIDVDADVGNILDVTFHRYDDAEKAVLLLFYEVQRRPGSPEPRAVDVAALRWASADEIDPSTFPPADVAILRKIDARLRRR